MLIPLAFIVGLAGFLLLPRIHDNSVLAASFAAAVVVLLAWFAVLWRRGRRLKIDVSLRPQHYLQAIAHTSIFVYWGIYWAPIADAAVLIAGQIVFAYAFDSLLSWTRKNEFALGFGPFPIIYSTNLFLRFRDDWFYWQFVMVAVGFLAKELIRWHRDGKRVHIFNPSSFPLALFSLVLILTGTSDITWAEGIATLLILPPYIYLFIFLVALPGQFLFGVTSMTLPAVLTTYGFSMLYYALNGTYFFFDSNVPIAVFLGMHLLFTDPSTAPKSELGRILFGVCYGLTVVALYAGLDAIGAPTYYDKLLQVPFMNLAVKWFDRVGRSSTWAFLNPARFGAALAPRARSAIWLTVWIVVFGAMTRAHGLTNYHPGMTVTFWQEACAAGRSNACTNLATVHRRYCLSGSAWSCNELALLSTDIEQRRLLFGSACRMRSNAACENLGRLASPATASFVHGDPTLDDYRLVLQGGRGAISEQTALDVFTRACNEGFVAACGSIGDLYFHGQDLEKNQRLGAERWQDACDRGHAVSCSNLGVMYRLGDSVAVDNAKAVSYMQRACDLGSSAACRTLALP